ncbi:DUF5666 domain-containing protein [Leptolyngbya sp. KIOST-1]|uniref:DUF5666 domain-containing protein n=1 Tax=Leptolyngbya sp. KIOST-1 TaxID=1229172 RepID=UPI0009077D50|nr:DUF5666 domain-containing protein [Leptolyngbya sp. KIOST-1]
MINRIVIGALVAGGIGAALVLPNLSHAQTTHTGTVEKVWEDGFRLNTGDRTLRVDAWTVYGDSTASHISVGDEVTITGEFEGREFDASTIAGTDSGSTAPAATSAPSEAAAAGATPRPAANTVSGTVERVWEDGFQLNTGDRTLRVDTWDVYGDNTASYISVGDRITMTGEFENGEFDASTVRPNP